MGTLSKCLLLFGLNWLDAQLTLIWVHLNVASEGNAFMAILLSHGDGVFLVFKLAIGAFAAYVLYRCSHLALARRGLSAVLVVYLGLMIVHAATGCFALGWHGPVLALAYLGSLPFQFVSLFC
ncbi:MAG TPA: DUF5658 family protein [Pyrinomonadaceae bacterium]|nr:DUF5658 family protein [Pyrinomonadaceae bacterium]